MWMCLLNHFVLKNVYVPFGSCKYYVSIFYKVADLFLFYYEGGFMMSLSDGKQAYGIDAFTTTSRYLDDILNINGVYFDKKVSLIYPSELQLNKANTLMYCNKLHAWRSTQSRLATLLSSLITRRMVGLQTL